MTTVLTHAARVLGLFVTPQGDVSRLGVDVIARALALPRTAAIEALDQLADADLINLERDIVQPTPSGVRLGHALASSRSEVEHRELTTFRPYWSYLPEEVDLRR